MSSNSSKNSLFYLEPLNLSDNSLFSIEEYDHVNNKRCRIESNDDREQSSTSLFSIEPFYLGKIRNIKVDTNHEESSLLNVDDYCVNEPLSFLCSDLQIAIDICKVCCGSLWLSKFE